MNIKLKLKRNLIGRILETLGILSIRTIWFTIDFNQIKIDIVGHNVVAEIDSCEITSSDHLPIGRASLNNPVIIFQTVSNPATIEEQIEQAIKEERYEDVIRLEKLKDKK